MKTDTGMAEFITTKQYDSGCWQCLRWVVKMDGKCKLLVKVTLHLQGVNAKKKNHRSMRNIFCSF